MSRNIILKLSIINLLVAIASCSNKNEELKKAIENVKVAYSDSIYFEISENNDSTFTPQQSLVLWYWDDSTVMFNIRPDSLNIQEDRPWMAGAVKRSEEHTSELQSRPHLVCRLLLEKKKENMSAGSSERAAVLSGCLQ